MWHLASDSSLDWLRQVEAHLDELLIDHAHCERKAAATALNLLSTYVENEPLCRAMTQIVNDHSTYVRLAASFGSEPQVRTRLAELARQAAEILALGDAYPRMHS